MTNLPTLLEYLDEDMNEAAKSVKQAISEKLAASTSNNSILLYNPQAALSSTKNNIENGYSIEDTISFNNAIVGYVSLIAIAPVKMPMKLNKAQHSQVMVPFCMISSSLISIQTSRFQHH